MKKNKLKKIIFCDDFNYINNFKKNFSNYEFKILTSSPFVMLYKKENIFYLENKWNSSELKLLQKEIEIKSTQIFNKIVKSNYIN